MGWSEAGGKRVGLKDILLLSVFQVNFTLPLTTRITTSTTITKATTTTKVQTRTTTKTETTTTNTTTTKA